MRKKPSTFLVYHWQKIPQVDPLNLTLASLVIYLLFFGLLWSPQASILAQLAFVLIIPLWLASTLVLILLFKVKTDLIMFFFKVMHILLWVLVSLIGVVQLILVWRQYLTA